jgi:hypothetical protein
MDISGLVLDENAQICLAIAHLRLIDLDIGASSSKERISKLKDRAIYIDKLKGLIPENGHQFSSSLSGEVARTLSSVAAYVKHPVSQAMILAEIAIADPWTGKNGFRRDKIDDHIRRLALNELGVMFKMVHVEDQTELILDNVISAASRALIDKERMFKVSGFAAVGAVVGGLVLAPHIGSAIGVAAGLHGAAAVSYGLASLGLGSLATGGFGMAGGTILVGLTSGVIGMGGASLSKALKDMHSDGVKEATKLRISLFLLSRNLESGDLVNEMKASIDFKVRELAIEELDEKRKPVQNKSRIKELKYEQRLLTACIPGSKG